MSVRLMLEVLENIIKSFRGFSDLERVQAYATIKLLADDLIGYAESHSLPHAYITEKAAPSSVSTVSDSNAIILSTQTRRTIQSEHHPTGSTPPRLRRSRLRVTRSLQTMQLQRPALI